MDEIIVDVWEQRQELDNGGFYDGGTFFNKWVSVIRELMIREYMHENDEPVEEALELGQKIQDILVNSNISMLGQSAIVCRLLVSILDQIAMMVSKGIYKDHPRDKTGLGEIGADVKEHKGTYEFLVGGVLDGLRTMSRSTLYEKMEKEGQGHNTLAKRPEGHDHSERRDH